jgi:hypothetical protein
VVESVTAAPGRLDGDPKVLDDLGLADVLVQPSRSEGLVVADLVGEGSGRDEAVGHAVSLPPRQDAEGPAEQVFEAGVGAVLP